MVICRLRPVPPRRGNLLIPLRGQGAGPELPGLDFESTQVPCTRRRGAYGTGRCDSSFRSRGSHAPACEIRASRLERRPGISSLGPLLHNLHGHNMRI